MGMHWDKYINRLKARRAEDPAYASIRRATAAMAEPSMAVNRQIQGNLALTGGSIGAKAELQNQAGQQMQNMQQNIIHTIPRQDTDALDQQITQMEMARDQEQEQRKDNRLKTILQAGGTALGAVAGTIIAPGAGTMLGAQIGSALGGTASGFVGGGGDMGWNYTDPQQVIQGVADTMQGISSAVTLGSQKQLATDFASAYPSMTNDDKEMYKLAILTRNTDLMRTILKRVGLAQNNANLQGVETDINTITPDERERIKLFNAAGVGLYG